MTPTLIALALVQATPAPAPADPQEARFRACADLVRTAPAEAADHAGNWQIEGGGFRARQCLGLAYVALGRWGVAAATYEEAARDAEATNDLRLSDLWAQAGNAWLAAGESTKAVHALDSALAAPGLADELRGEVHADRARALVALGNIEGAREDLDRALALVPGDPFVWYLSAALAQRRGDLVRARADIARATTLAPDDADIGLLAGTLAGLAGDMAEAERLYRRVADGAPDSVAGRAARASLETMREVEVPATAEPQAVPASDPQSR